MRKAKNDPGLQVGDKIRFFETWIDRNGKRVTREFPKKEFPMHVTKINSRFFYTEEKRGLLSVELRIPWDCTFSHMDDGTWSVTRDSGTAEPPAE